MSLFSPFSILNIDNYSAVQGSTLSTDEGLSNLVSSILPEFVVSDHPTFVSFIKAYFEFLDQKGNSRFAATTIEKNVDVDQTLDSFVTFFREQYLSNFPEKFESEINERFIVKSIKDYYQEKGNPRSLDLLFRILFGTSSDTEFPREKILTLSDAQADTRPKIILTNFQGIENFSEDESYQIKQTIKDDPTTGFRASAFLDDVKVVNFEGTNFIHADLLDVRGSFIPTVPVQIFGLDGDATFENIVPVFSDINISNAGTGYTKNDTVVIKNAKGKVIETLKIKKVSNTGAILQLEKINQLIPDFGSYDISIESTGSNASLLLTNQIATITRPKVYKSQKSLVSSDSFIQDNNKYQQFSYIVKAQKSLDEYSNLLRKLFHPAGAKFFGQYNFAREFSLNTVTADSLAGITGGVAVRPVIGHYFPYTMAATFDLRGDTFGSTFADYYPTGYNGLTAATFGNFGSTLGLAVTHDPFNNGTFVTGPLGGNTGGTFAPDYWSTGIVKKGYEPLTQNQLRMVFADAITAPFFNIFRHPKNMEITGTIYAADEDQYKSGDIEDTVVELAFDPSYNSVLDPHNFGNFPVVGSVAIQTKETYEIGATQGALSKPTVQAFGTVVSPPSIIPTSDTRFYIQGRTVQAAGLGFRVQIRVHDGEFINTGYTRYPTKNQTGYVEFVQVINPLTGERRADGSRPKRFIAQSQNQSDNIRLVGVTGASFQFQDIKVGDFLDRMRLTSLGLTGSTAENGITFQTVI